uniref:MD-2-related lipid-recognition domain-containing protein n=1 Tax=Amphimedon queenslandica TaxID=400682 RepID=A0A1X7V8B8_AMPQE
MSALLIILSVVLVISTLTGSIDNYHNAVTKKFVELTNTSITPVPLKRGEMSYWKGLLKIKRTIHWGIVHLTLTHNFKNYTNITFLNENFNLCDYLDDIIKEYCPVHPGIYHMNASTTMSKLLRPGQYYARVTAYNEKGEQLYAKN